MKTHIVILAGGTGTRLWPASNVNRPKQFLDFGTGLSLFQHTLKRAIGLQEEGSIIIVTHKTHTEPLLEQVHPLLSPDKPEKNLIVLAEPEGKNTAPATALAAFYLKQSGEENSRMVVLPADHFIEPLPVFIREVKQAIDLAKHDVFVTFGITPAYPSTGYGYIQTGEKLGEGYSVLSFKEKPDTALAEKYIASGNYLWNSGMFVFHCSLFLNELRAYAETISRQISGYKFTPAETESYRIYRATRELSALYELLPSISIDKAIMEKSRKKAVIPASFSWSDVGSWDEVSKQFKEHYPSSVTVQAQNNFILSDIPVALAGVDDLIVVIKNGIALVCKKGNSELIKQIANQIE